MRRYTFIVLFFLVLAAPFVLRAVVKPGDSAARTARGRPRLVVITPNNQDIRREFARAFSEWHQAHFGTAVEIDYRTPGGTNDIKRQLADTYKSWQDPQSAPVRLYYVGWSTSTGEADWALRPLLYGESWPPKLFNTAYYKNPKFDADIKNAQLATASGEKAKLYKDAQETAWNDAPWAPLVVERLLSAHNKKLSGVYVIPDASFDFWQVDLKQ